MSSDVYSMTKYTYLCSTQLASINIIGLTDTLLPRTGSLSAVIAVASIQSRQWRRIVGYQSCLAEANIPS